MKRIRKVLSNYKNIFFFCFAAILVLSYTTNLFLISDKDLFHGFERQPEGLVVGRLIKAQTDGIFSDGGLTGINYPSQDSITEKSYSVYQSMQHDIYITEREAPDAFYAYKSQSGGQAISLAIIGKILPFDNLKKMMIYRLLNAIIIATIFTLFARWIARNFGFIAAVVTLFFIFLSPWINMFSHSLWWVLWNFYLPFIVMLLLCENYYNRNKKFWGLKFWIFTTLSVLLKCWFTGFEFITTTLIAGFVPFVYYCYLNKSTISKFLVQGFCLGISMLIGLLLQMIVLIVQIESYTGIANSGLAHIKQSFIKRTATEIVHLWDVLVIYLSNDSFSLGFLSNSSSFYFGTLLSILLITSIIIFIVKSKNRKIKALFLAFTFSFLAPLSWLIIFKQHAWIHLHMDYIVWYIPTLLYGFAFAGIGINLLIKKLFTEKIK